MNPFTTKRTFRVLRAARMLELSIALIGTIGLVPIAQADDYLPKLGGPGGSQFNAPCPAGQNLTGFELRTGDDINAIRPVCAVAYGPKEVVNVAPLPAWHGGPDGHVESLLCPANTPALLGMLVETEGIDTLTLNSIHLYCGKVAAVAQPIPPNPSAVYEGKAYVRSPGWGGIGIDGEDARHSWSQERCPDGEIAVGMHGRTGVWVDAAGLICDAPRLTQNPHPPVALGRVQSTTPTVPMSLCERAKAARARNSPAAPALEAQCKASIPPVALGRVQSTAPKSDGPPVSICDAAAAARDRNAPTAARLAEQCRAIGGTVPAPLVPDGPSTEELAAKGAAIAAADPLATMLREEQPEGPIRTGFDIGMGAAEGNTAWGPGKQQILQSLPGAQQEGFKVAMSYALDRNRNMDLAVIGAAIAEGDPSVATPRNRQPDARYRLGFDIASGLFGDPGLGAKGNTATGPGSMAIRDALGAIAQRGFNAGVAFHLSRKY
jgi:hypothetical protein